MDKLLDLDDIDLVPGQEHTTQYPDVFYPGNCLIETPLMTEASMNIAIELNYKKFENAGITPVLSAGTLRQGIWFCARNTTHFEDIINFTRTFPDKVPLSLVLNLPEDLPSDICHYIWHFKNLGHNVIIDNVVSPDLYAMYADEGADYCILRESLSPYIPLHYKMGSLIMHSYQKKKEGNYKTGIIAAGIDTIHDGIKAMALGAEHIMMLKPMVLCFESSAKITSDKGPISTFWEGNSEKVHLEACGSVFLEKEGKLVDNPPEHRKQSLVTLANITKRYSPVNENYKPCYVDEFTGPVTYTADMYSRQFNKALQLTMAYTGHSKLWEFIGYIPASYTYS